MSAETRWLCHKCKRLTHWRLTRRGVERCEGCGDRFPCARAHCGHVDCRERRLELGQRLKVAAAAALLLIGCSVARAPIAGPSSSSSGSSGRNVLGPLVGKHHSDAGVAIATIATLSPDAGDAGVLGQAAVDGGDAGELHVDAGGELQRPDAGDAGVLHVDAGAVDAGPRNACGGRRALAPFTVGASCAGPLACSSAPPAAMGCWTCVTTEQLACCNCAP